MAEVATIDACLRTIDSGRAILFTGAGFSCGACDVAGQPLPDSARMIDELWSLCFGACERDDSTLSDLYDVALTWAPDQLQAYVERRLRVGDCELPVHLARWFAAPWLRIYTLNVDDLDVAIARQYQLPRKLRPRSALDASFTDGDGGDDDAALDVIHLNGLVASNAIELTFSTLQYAARLCGRDPAYSSLADDLLTSPFVFAGTTLDEVVLWQHYEMHRRQREPEPAVAPPPLYLITPSLSRARQVLLETLGITWVRATIEEVAARFPGPPPPRRSTR